jgi:hypothetical protein
MRQVHGDEGSETLETGFNHAGGSGEPPHNSVRKVRIFAAPRGRNAFLRRVATVFSTNRSANFGLVNRFKSANANGSLK